MKILKVCFGNSQEAFCEENFSEGINIIFSQGVNNRGKTVVIQSIFYALGYEPKFPYGFDSQLINYYVVEIENEGKKYIICRHKKTFAIKKENGDLIILKSESEFKKFYSENIHSLPYIKKDNNLMMVYLSLFNQMFFLGQDGKDTSKLYNTNYFKKEDFFNMIYSMKDISNDTYNDDIIVLEKEKKNLKNERKNLRSKMKIINKHKEVKIISYVGTEEDKEEKIKKLDFLWNNFTEYKKETNKLISNKIKNEALIRELKSLKKEISIGKLYCLECGAKNRVGVSIDDSDMIFDITNSEIEKIIIKNIEYRISDIEKEIIKKEQQIYDVQEEIKKNLKEENVTIEDFLLYNKEILSIYPLDKKIKEIDTKIKEIDTKIKEIGEKIGKNKTKKYEIINEIQNKLNEKFRFINYDGNNKKVDIFTKRSEIVSGSESAAFFLAKFYALQKCLNHNHPIIIDDFREKELSSDKEIKALEMYKKLPNQIIFTCTLKNEEINKYQNSNFINQIDYSNKKDSHILNEKDVIKLKLILGKMNIQLL